MLRKRKFLNRILTVSAAAVALGAMAFSQVVPLWQGVGGTAAADPAGQAQVKELTGDIDTQIEKYLDPSVVSALPDTVKDTDEISVIVKSQEKTILDAYEEKGKTVGSVADFSTSSAGKAVSDRIAQKNASLYRRLKETGIELRAENTYDVLMSGFEVVIQAKDFDALSEALGDDATAIVSEVYEPCETQLVENDVNVFETGIFDSSNSKYDGTGTVVAVLDTGLDYTHSAFSMDTFTSDNPALSLEDVAAVIGDMRAAETTEGLNAEDVYLNARVPYAYDYADKDPDVYPIESEHGTHVSGIILGKDDTIRGVAPNAQLVSMKVFSDTETGARNSWILAALEDCVTLGVDVINMSLGTACGFSREVDREEFNVVYDKIAAKGISLVAAASNDYNSTFGSEKNGNLGLTSNPDSGTVGSPSTYEASLSVASISGVKTPYLLYNDTIIYFTESTNAAAEPKSFVEEILPAGTESATFEYVTIPGIGRTTDYSGIDVTGKIALVRRGDTSFEEKSRVAMNRGAAGLIIYNNVSGDIAMTVGNVDIAVCSISQDNGEMLAAQQSGTITISRSQVAGPFMSDFSSWGPTPDLRIKPEITAHGGDILSAVPGQSYDRISGTSMAAPNQAGFTALVRQYVKETFTDIANDPVAVTARVYQLTMSTADIAYNTNGLAYSVRKQGAGLANLTKATSTPAYLTTFDADGSVMNKAKLELGDDKDKTGVYTMKFAVNNVSASSLTYDVNAIVMTEGVSETLTHQGDTTVTQEGYLLSGATVSVTNVTGGTQSGNTVTVAANGTAEVTVTVTLSDADKQYLNESFSNGMYVEGFVTLTAKGGTDIDLNVPYLAFYGDWTQAPIFDKDYFETNRDEIDDSIDLLDKTLPDAYATRPVGGLSLDYINYLGSYYFIQDPSSPAIAADRKYVSLSNQEDAVNSIYAIWAGFLRGAKRVEMTITDTSTGEVIFTQDSYNHYKSYNNGGSIIYSSIDVDFSVLEHDLKNNTKYDVKLTAYLDYGDGGIDTNTKNVFEFPFVTDFESPALTGTRFYTEYDRTEKKTHLYVDLSIYDNHYAMGAQVGYIYQDDDGYIMDTFADYVTPIYSEYNTTSVITYELTDYIDQIKQSHNGNTFIVACYDYAMNQAIYEVEIPDDIKALYFNETELTLSPYEVYSLEPVVYPEDAWGATVEYSYDESVVNIVNGKLIAVAPGETTVVAKSARYDAKAEIKVKVLSENEEGYVRYDKPVAEEFRLTGYTTDRAYYLVSSSDRDIGLTGYETKVGSASTFSLSMYPAEKVTAHYQLDAYFPATTEVRFETSNERIVTVDQAGTIKAVSEGAASITVSVYMDGAPTFYSQTIDVTVKDPYETNASYLLSYRGNGGIVEIPADLSLTQISQYAFSGYQYIPKDENDEISEEDPYLSKIWYVGDDNEEYPVPEEDKITKVIIPEGVEVIDAFAFAGLTALREVVLPSTLQKINQNAFYGCTSLRSVEGLEYVKFINQDAFNGCALTQVDLSSIVAIGNSAFEGNELVTLTLPETAQSLGMRAFYGNASLYDVAIEAERVKLGSEAFAQCSSLHSVDINASVIPANAFDGCTSLSSVTLGKDVSVLGAYAFRGTSVAKFTVDQGNTLIKASADGSYLTNFKGDTLLLVAPDRISNAFTADSAIKAVGDGAFAGMTTLTSVTLPGVTKVGDNAFAGCTALRSVTLGTLTSVGDYAFAETALTRLPALAEGQTLGAYAFSGSKLTSVNIPSGINVGDYAFADCTSLQSVVIGDRVELGTGAFYMNYGDNFVFPSVLTSLTLGDNVIVGDSAFYGADYLERVTMGTGIEIGDYAFYNNTSLADIDLSGVTRIGSYAFCGLFLYSQNTQTGEITYIFNSAPLTSVDLTACESLGEYAFAVCSSLTSVKLGENLTEIAANAFANCEKLASIDLSHVKKVGSGAFSMTALEEVDLPSAEEVGDGAFMGMPSLTSVTLKGDVKIGASAFESSEKLATVNGIDKVTEIGSYAFAGTALTAADLSNAVSLGDFAFAATPLTSVTLGDKLVSVGENPFAQCKIPAFTRTETVDFNGTKFEEETDTFTISESVLVMDGALYTTNKLGYELVTYPAGRTDASFTVAEGTTRISAQAFSGSALRSAVLPLTLKSIGDKAFYGCTQLSTVTFKSLEAPILEEQYDVNYLLLTNLPFTGSLQISQTESVDGLGIVPYYMWNVTSMYNNFYFGANFVDYIGHVDTPLVMVRPYNGTNYDSFIYGQYFTSIVEGQAAPDATTLEAIEAIDKIPASSQITLETEAVIQAARAAYDRISTTVQQALVTNYSKLTEAENIIAFLKGDGNNEKPPEEDPPKQQEGPDALVITLSVLLGVFGAAAIAEGVLIALHFVKKSKQSAGGAENAGGSADDTQD